MCYFKVYHQFLKCTCLWIRPSTNLLDLGNYNVYILLKRRDSIKFEWQYQQYGIEVMCHLSMACVFASNLWREYSKRSLITPLKPLGLHVAYIFGLSVTFFKHFELEARHCNFNCYSRLDWNSHFATTE